MVLNPILIIYFREHSILINLNTNVLQNSVIIFVKLSSLVEHRIVCAMICNIRNHSLLTLPWVWNPLINRELLHAWSDVPLVNLLIQFSRQFADNIAILLKKTMLGMCKRAIHLRNYYECWFSMHLNAKFYTEFFLMQILDNSDRYIVKPRYKKPVWVVTFRELTS